MARKWVVAVTPEGERVGDTEYVARRDRRTILGSVTDAVRYDEADAEVVASYVRASWVAYGHSVHAIPDPLPSLEDALREYPVPPPRPGWMRRLLNALGL